MMKGRIGQINHAESSQGVFGRGGTRTGGSSSGPRASAALRAASARVAVAGREPAVLGGAPAPERTERCETEISERCDAAVPGRAWSWCCSKNLSIDFCENPVPGRPESLRSTKLEDVSGTRPRLCAGLLLEIT